MDDVLAGAEHDAEHGEFRQGAADIPDVRAQFASVERPRHHRAAALRAARRLGVIVGKGQGHVEAHGGVGGEKIHRLRTRGQESVDPRGIEAVAGLMAQIRPRLVGALDDAPVAREPRAGNPEPTAGTRRGAAKALFLLDHKDLEAAVSGGDRGRQAGAAGADYQHIVFIGVAFAVCHAIVLTSSQGPHLDLQTGAESTGSDPLRRQTLTGTLKSAVSTGRQK